MTEVKHLVIPKIFLLQTLCLWSICNEVWSDTQVDAESDMLLCVAESVAVE